VVKIIVFFPLETKKTMFLCYNFKNPGVLCPVPLSDAHA